MAADDGGGARGAHPPAGGMTEAHMKIDGQCHCGRITFEAEVDPEAVTLCHCTDCQVLTGTAFRSTVPAPAASFVLHGEPSRYIKIADSGARRVQAFCPSCGASIYSAADVEQPETYGLRIGTIKQRAQLKPANQIWRHSALPWMMNIEDVESFEREA
jgi:hypothetical protein